MKTKREPVPSSPWYLRIKPDADGVSRLVRAIDCAGDPLCVYRNRKDALEGAASALAMYDIDCHPVQE